MPNQTDDGGRTGPWGSGARQSADFEDMVRQGQDRLKRMFPGAGGPRTIVTIALLALFAWGA
jgi:membrane protease subunit HflK